MTDHLLFIIMLSLGMEVLPCSLSFMMIGLGLDLKDSGLEYPRTHASQPGMPLSADETRKPSCR